MSANPSGKTGWENREIHVKMTGYAGIYTVVKNKWLDFFFIRVELNLIRLISLLFNKNFRNNLYWYLYHKCEYWYLKMQD